jgi:hypothetical protein
MEFTARLGDVNAWANIQSRDVDHVQIRLFHPLTKYYWLRGERAVTCLAACRGPPQVMGTVTGCDTLLIEAIWRAIKAQFPGITKPGDYALLTTQFIRKMMDMISASVGEVLPHHGAAVERAVRLGCERRGADAR